jgi:Holliday junction resolvase RusA-like endonuclease
MKLSFVIPGEPQGKGRPRFTARNGFPRAITPEKTASYESLIKAMYWQEYGNLKLETGPVSMVIRAYYGIPPSASKRRKAAMIAGEIRPCKKPDVDNVVKVVADSLNGVAYRDDTQIVWLHCEKWYSEKPRVEVVIMTED